MEATVASTGEPTPGELVGLGRPPYLVDLMQARPAYETFDVAEQMTEIDTFIRDGIDDTRNAYENAYKGLLIHINKTGDIYTDLAQLREYVRIQNKIKAVIKEKEDFEAKDPNEMSANELKRYFKNANRL